MGLKTIGITGGIGSGKSSVAGILAKMGFVVISADAVAHAELEKGKDAYAKIVDHFGAAILGPDGQINRRALGKIVFDDSLTRQKLESILHPMVIADIQKQIACFSKSGQKAVFVEVPLLFEVGMERMFDEVWVVSVSPEEQMKRLAERDKLSGRDIRRRISAQLPLAEKETRADRVINNNCGMADLERQVNDLLHTLELI
jgi:dephospho-CoA kinase